MLDFGWPELFVIIALIVILAGPEDIPKVMIALGRITRRISYIKYAMSQQFEEFMREADLEDIRKSVNFEASDETGRDMSFEEAEGGEQYAELYKNQEDDINDNNDKGRA